MDKPNSFHILGEWVPEFDKKNLPETLSTSRNYFCTKWGYKSGHGTCFLHISATHHAAGMDHNWEVVFHFYRNGTTQDTFSICICYKCFSFLYLVLCFRLWNVWLTITCLHVKKVYNASIPKFFGFVSHRHSRHICMLIFAQVFRW